MAKVHTAGIPAQRWLAVGFVLTMVLVAVPLGLSELALGGNVPPSSTGKQAPVPQNPPAQGEKNTAATTAVAGHVDAHTLLAMFREHDVSLDKVRSGEAPVPRIVMAGLPRDLGKLDNIDDRKDAFVNTMLPLVLMVNEEIGRDRTRLQGLAAQIRTGAPVAPADQHWLEDLAARYGLAGKTVGGRVDTDALLRRVDVVPVSMVLAQAAQESGWGTSRFAQHGNALFGQLTWGGQDKGIAPRNRQPGETYRFRRFDDLLESIRGYEQNLNSHDAYARFRATRASLRRQGKPLDSIRLISTLDRYSERGMVYVKSLVSLIRSNDLGDFDQAVLHQDAGHVTVSPRSAPASAPASASAPGAAVPPVPAPGPISVSPRR